MQYQCLICKAAFDYELKSIIDHGGEHVIAAIKEKHPEWASSDGVCQKYYDHYKEQVAH